MAISELKALVDLVGQVTSFASQVQRGWYRRSAELDAFQNQVDILSERQLQFTDQLQRYGVSDERLLHAIRVAFNSLKKQQQYVEKLQKSCWLRSRIRAFPSDLPNALRNIVELVDAGPQLLALRVATNDLVERYRTQSPVPLPFGPDRNYVPISGCVREVQKALEDAIGPHVVTVYGEPGIGKSSLAKYVALQYEERRKMRGDSTVGVIFPDGVQYLSCGLGANQRIKELQLELLEKLGFGVKCGAPPQIDPAASSAMQHLDCFDRTSNQTRLLSRLAEQQLLIILNDLWEAEVLEDLFVPAPGVKYLVTSQIRDIWLPAKKIQLKRPIEAEARQILANYTEGLRDKNGVMLPFPEQVKVITDTIIRKFYYHPLSLANVGMSILNIAASDPSNWKRIENHLQDDVLAYLEDNSTCFTPPRLYESPYKLTVPASMMLMVEAIHPEARKLLDLIALLQDPELPDRPESLVKFFFRRLQTSRFDSQYTARVKFLEGRSLIELWKRRGELMVSAHGLRTQFIRGMRKLQVTDLAAQLLGDNHDRHGSIAPIEGGDHEILAVIIGAMEFAEPFNREAAAILVSHVKFVNSGEIPRPMKNRLGELDIVRGSKNHQSFGFRTLYRFLNPEGEDEWKQQAYEASKNIIIKFICHGELHDESMAQLLQLPQTTSIACHVLRHVWHLRLGKLFYSKKRPFSSAHEQTMTILLALLGSDSTTTRRRVNVINTVPVVLAFERDDTIVEVAGVWKKLLGMDSQPALQIACTSIFKQFFGVRERMGSFGLWEALVGLFVSGKDDQVRIAAGDQICAGWFWSTDLRSRIVEIPDIFRTLFNIFLSEVTLPQIRLCSGDVLWKLSSVPENRINLIAMEGGLEGLADILAKLQSACGATGDKSDCEEFVDRAFTAARILGELAVSEELRRTIVSCPGIVDGLLFLHPIEKSTSLELRRLYYDFYLYLASTRTFGDIEASTNVPHSNDKRPELHEDPREVVQLANVWVYWSRIPTHIETRTYYDALEDVDLALYHLSKLPQGQQKWRWAHSEELTLCRWRIFYQAVLEDYSEALISVNNLLERKGKNALDLRNRAVLKRQCRDFKGALEDLNVAMQLISPSVQPHLYGPWHVRKYLNEFDILKHRGYVKHLMGDDAGAKIDGEAAQQLKPEGLDNMDHKIQDNKFFLTLGELGSQPSSYLGFSF